MQSRMRILALGTMFFGGCVGLDEGPATTPQDPPAEPSISMDTPADPVDEASPREPGPTIELAHTHAVEPAADLAAARRTQAGLDPTDPRWVEEQHRIALAVMLESAAATSPDRWSAALDEFQAAVDAPSQDQYAHVDELLFDYASLALRSADAARGQEQLLALIRHYPRSPLIPHAYAAFADHMFDDGQVANAAQLYSKLASFDDPALSAYASYRIGWCHLADVNGNDALALEMFVQAVRHAEALDDGWGRRLRAAALDDATLAYAQVGAATEARDFFTPIARDADIDPERPLQRLIEAYAELGDDEAVAVLSAF